MRSRVRLHQSILFAPLSLFESFIEIEKMLTRCPAGITCSTTISKSPFSAVGRCYPRTYWTLSKPWNGIPLVIKRKLCCTCLPPDVRAEYQIGCSAVLNVCCPYTSRDEITTAIKRTMAQVENGTLSIPSVLFSSSRADR